MGSLNCASEAVYRWEKNEISVHVQFLRGPDDVYSKHDIKMLIRIISSRMLTAAILTLQGRVFRESEAPKLWSKFTLGYSDMN